MFRISLPRAETFKEAAEPYRTEPPWQADCSWRHLPCSFRLRPCFGHTIGTSRLREASVGDAAPATRSNMERVAKLTMTTPLKGKKTVPHNYEDVVNLITADYENLSTRFQQIARFFTQNPNVVALESINAI